MDIQARKIHFVQEFLRITDEELVIKLEKLLHVERKKRLAMELGSLTIEELNKIVDQSEDDFNNSRATEARNLLNQIDE